MAVTKPSVKLATLGAALVVCLFYLLASPPSAAAAQSFRVAPVEDPSAVRLLPATAWPPPESDQGQMLLKLSYLRGLLDALQYVEVAPRTAGRVLEKLKGMNLHELAAAIDRYYLLDPRRRDLPPASVLFRILPASRGKPEPSLIKPRPRMNQPASDGPGAAPR